MSVRITSPIGGTAAPARSLSVLYARLDAEIEAIRRSVETADYPLDPILGAHSRLASMGAAYVRRHGMLAATCLGYAIDALSNGRLEVLHEFDVPITRVAEEVVRANAKGRTADIDLPEGGALSGLMRLDLVVISEELGIGWLIEVKRANCDTYERKLRAPLQRLEAARLSAGAALKGSYRIGRLEAVLVSLYGTSSNPSILARGGLDAFFGLAIEAELDRLDERYRQVVVDSLHSRIAKDFLPPTSSRGSDLELTSETDTAEPSEPGPLPITPAQLFAKRHPVAAAASPAPALRRDTPRFAGAA